MDGYISKRECALKWGISERRVNQYLLEGRVPGAFRFGKSWAIPETAEKPDNPQGVHIAPEQKTVAYSFSPVFVMPKTDPDAILKTLPVRERGMAICDLAYMRGDLMKIKIYWHMAREGAEERDLSAALAYTSAFATDDDKMKTEITGYYKQAREQALGTYRRAIYTVVQALDAVCMNREDEIPDWLKSCDFSVFPSMWRPFMLYLHTLYQRTARNHKGVYATATAALALCEKEATFTNLDIYFHLLAAWAAYRMDDEAHAQIHVHDAVTLGAPFGFVTPYAEYLTACGNIVSDELDRSYPDLLDKVEELWDVCFSNWTRARGTFSNIRKS